VSESVSLCVYVHMPISETWKIMDYQFMQIWHLTIFSFTKCNKHIKLIKQNIRELTIRIALSNTE
jgi:hypothetical protein